MRDYFHHITGRESEAQNPEKMVYFKSLLLVRLSQESISIIQLLLKINTI